MTKVKTKEMSKASQKRQKESLAVTALENATVAALQVGAASNVGLCQLIIILHSRLTASCTCCSWLLLLCQLHSPCTFAVQQ